MRQWCTRNFASWWGLSRSPDLGQTARLSNQTLPLHTTWKEATEMTEHHDFKWSEPFARPRNHKSTATLQLAIHDIPIPDPDPATVRCATLNPKPVPCTSRVLFPFPCTPYPTHPVQLRCFLPASFTIPQSTATHPNTPNHSHAPQCAPYPPHSQQLSKPSQLHAALDARPHTNYLQAKFDDANVERAHATRQLRATLRARECNISTLTLRIVRDLLSK